MKTYGVIMAGGGGTRFWPLSRKQTPKQLLNLSGKDVMVNEAIDRLARVTDYKNVFIVTNATQKSKMVEVVSGRITENHILAEPAARNTAACIGYAAIEILKKYGDGVMLITPSDAYIKDSEKFADILKVAVREAQASDKLITIGISPTYPATGYGYIQYARSDKQAKNVLKFVEKPDREKAKDYLKSGDFVWNSGMFVWKASVILNNFKTLLPEVYSYLEKMSDSFGTKNETDVINELYPQIPSVSIDYGIMEKSKDIVVIPGEFGWNDIGSLDMFNVIHDEDDNGNVLLGDVLAFDTKHTTLYSSGRLVAAIGVDNLIVVETPDAILVCQKDRAQDVKKIVEELKSNDREALL